MPTPLSTEQLAQLAQLKDIHLPAPMTDFQLALGWWVLIGVALLSLLLLGRYAWRKRYALRQHALAELAQLSKQHRDDAQALAAALSPLLKRIVRQRESVARHTATDSGVEMLSGKAWQAYLQAHNMPAATAAAIAVAPYAKDFSNGINTKTLNQHAKQWIRRMT